MTYQAVRSDLNSLCNTFTFLHTTGYLPESETKYTYFFACQADGNKYKNTIDCVSCILDPYLDPYLSNLKIEWKECQTLPLTFYSTL